jgi:hypothetical protein
MSDVAKELVVKIGHLQAKSEAAPLADLVISLIEHKFSTDQLVSSGLSKLGTHRAPSRWQSRGWPDEHDAIQLWSHVSSSPVHGSRCCALISSCGSAARALAA